MRPVLWGLSNGNLLVIDKSPFAVARNSNQIRLSLGLVSRGYQLHRFFAHLPDTRTLTVEPSEEDPGAVWQPLNHAGGDFSKKLQLVGRGDKKDTEYLIR